MEYTHIYYNDASDTIFLVHYLQQKYDFGSIYYAKTEFDDGSGDIITNSPTSIPYLILQESEFIASL